jgi:1-acyl-sn-glycerol-3-phosphate acyltransferase
LAAGGDVLRGRRFDPASAPKSRSVSSCPRVNLAFYKTGRLACRFVKAQCVREVVLHAERADRNGGFVLACTHLGHVEPLVAGVLVRRPVHWMARKEHYRRWWAAAVLRRLGAFPVDRGGFSLPAVRRSIRLARGGEVVGVFPEGGVAHGRESVLRGGAFKLGVCTIAIRAGVPVVPVVILGTDKLNSVGPWMPFKRARVWVAFGRDVRPPEQRMGNRADRARMGERLGAEFRATYEMLLDQMGLSDGDVP